MELDKIEQLIEKYEEAKTTLKEESILKDYFTKKDIPAHLIEYKYLFNYYNKSALEYSSKSITLENISVSLKWLSVAAMIVFFVGILSVYQNNITEKKEAQQAYLETQKALKMISNTLNKGNNAIAQLQVFEKTQNRIFKNK